MVVAGGTGERFGARKQFELLSGRSVLDRAVDACRASADSVVAVLPKDDVGRSSSADRVVAGGATRSESVRAGLAAVPEGAEIVVVHDGVRPLAPAALFDSVIDAVRAGADGAVPCLPLIETLKRVAGTKVVETVEREGLVVAQTPQAFRAGPLRRAHRGDPQATDDAALVEAGGGLVVTVPGDPRNLKLTAPCDLGVAQAILDAWPTG